MSPNDGDQLAAYLKLLHDDSALRKKLSDNALRAYQQHPGWDDTGHSIRKFFTGTNIKGRMQW